MGALKVIKALEESCHIKNINWKVRNYIKSCHICQLVKTNNEKKEGIMIPITSKEKLEKVFLDICRPFPRSGGRHRYKYLIIIMDHFTKFIKLYPVNRATTLKILGVITELHIPEIGKPSSIITDHGTQFKGKRWRDTLLSLGIKTYKTSVYHPSSNPAERVLREVGRILRTYCHHQQKKMARISGSHGGIPQFSSSSSYRDYPILRHVRETTPTRNQGNHSVPCLLYTSRCV